MNNNRVDKELAFWNKGISPKYMQPFNVDQEKKRLFADRTYNPKFRYNKHPKIRQIKYALLQLKPDYSVLGILLNQKKCELMKKLNMYEAVGTNLFTNKSIECYGKPDEKLVRKAKSFLNLKDDESESLNYNTISSIKKFLDSLLKFGYDWKVVENEMCVAARFSVSDRILYINKERKFNENDIKRLIIHEIGTHIKRAENAKTQKYRLFLIGFPNYLETEEGLAVYNEERAGLLTNKVLKNYAGRVIAVDLALKNSFSTVYNELLEFFDKEDAWTLTLRAKRGIGDTSRPGACTKDYLYLKGKYLIEDYVKKGGKLKDLYVGKIGVQHVKLLKEIY